MAKIQAGSNSLEARSGELMSIPLSLLQASPRNVRKTDGQDVSALKATIRAQGVLQNLIVCPVEPQVRKGRASEADVQRYEVVGGLRRLRALRELQADGEIGADEPILCRVKPSREAAEASLVENVARLAMHPADEFEAFKALVDAGRSVQEVAQRFGTTPLKVRRCLKLANLHPQLIELYRQDGIELAQLTALALVANPDEQLQCWNALPDWQRDAHSLRRLLLQQDIDAGSDPVAKYVGVDAYEAAGGALRRDLFSEGEEGGVYLLDAALLHRLAEEKLQAVAEEVRSEGWSWVDVAVRLPWSQLVAFGHCPKAQRSMNRREQRHLDALRRRATTLAAQLTQACGDSEDDDEQVSKLEAEAEVAREAVEAFEAGLAVFDSEALSRGGALVALGSHGEVEVHRGLLRPSPSKGARTASGSSESCGEDNTQGYDGESARPATSKAVHSAALMLNLTAHRTMAARAAMLDQPRVALVALLHGLVQRLLYDGYGLADTPVRLIPHQADAGLISQVFDPAESRASEVLDAVRQRWGERLPGDAGRLFGWLMALGDGERAELLALCVALTLNDVRDSERASPLDRVAEALSLDMAQWWQPTALGYFSRVTKETILAALAEGAGPEAAARVKGVSKQELAWVAERELKDCGWLPQPLRVHECNGGGPVVNG